jgi:Xaa-Pro aminopeptidase
MPHHRPGPRPIRRGDPVVVDFGATYEGYRSDMTRTFCVGAEPEGDMARVFAVVGASQAAGAAAVRPGILAKEVDDVCRAIITEAGWSDRFEHGTGHGVGLDIHEAPTVSQLGTATLAPGFVVTVEPGVYLPGQGGVRVEDTLVVTEGGSRPLTRFTKDIHGILD